MAKQKLIVPFLKWVGGKRQLMSAIEANLPKNIAEHTYCEPFLGGGAVFFHLLPGRAIVNDFNSELVNVYEVIKHNLDELLADLKKHRNEAEYFYALRGIDRSPEFFQLTAVQRASRVIFLNKTCFNGLYRVNSAGEFNSPFGKYKNPNIVNEQTLKAVSQYLNTNDITLTSGDYENVLRGLKKEAFVYLDPPYHPLSASSNFTGYVQGGWGEHDQIRLRKACDNLNERGIKFLLSNSATPFIKDQYKNYCQKTVKANRAINSDGEKRGEVEELLIKNYE